MRKILFLCLIYVCITSCAAAPFLSDQSIAQKIQSRADLSFDNRLDRFSCDFIGVPYQNDPLGEAGGIDPDPVYRFDSFDCVTYVETVIALTRAQNFKDFADQKIRVSYKDEILNYEHRKHFFEMDHKNDFTDITNNLGTVVNYITGTIDRQSFLEKRIDSIQGNYKTEKVILSYIEKNDVSKIDTKKLPRVSIVGIVQDNPGLRSKVGSDVLLSHVGFLISDNGNLSIRHAGTAAGYVVDQDFKSYIDNLKTSKIRRGIKIWQIKSLND